MAVRHPEFPEDIPDLIRLHGLAWREAYQDALPQRINRQIPVEPTDAAMADWEERLDAHCDGILVAERAGTVRGYIFLRWGEETKAFVGENEAGLKEIYVHPDDWGAGIGTQLLDKGLDLLPEDIEAVTLETLAGNTVAQQFYEKRGFEQAGTTEYELSDETYPSKIYRLSL